MGQQRGVELLGTRRRGPPLEEPHGVGAVGDVGQAVAQHLAGCLRRVHRLPVDRAGRVLHQQPRRAAGQSPGEVAAERQLGLRVGLGGHQVVVGADDVLVRGPAGVVQVSKVAQRHEVRGDRHTRGHPLEHRALGQELVEQGVGGEPAVVQQLGGVARGRCLAGRQDVLEGGVALAPEAGAPRVVHRRDVAVPAPQPLPERGRAGVAVARRVVAAVLVRDVPHRQRRVVAVALRHRLGEAHGVVAEDRRAGAVGLPPAGPQSVAVAGHRQRVGVAVREPGRRRGGAGGQVDGDATLVQQVHDLVQPAQVEASGLGLERRPGEDPHRDEADAGLAHQRDVLRPHVAGPLLGVVVAAESDAVGGPGAHGAQPDR